MNVSWFEVGMGFFAMAYIAGQSLTEAVGMFHGVATSVVAVPVFLYGSYKGVRSMIMWGMGRDR